MTWMATIQRSKSLRLAWMLSDVVLRKMTLSHIAIQFHSKCLQMEPAVQREARHASMRHYQARQPTSETVLAEQHKVRLAAAWLAHSQANGHALHRSSTSGFGLTML